MSQRNENLENWLMFAVVVLGFLVLGFGIARMASCAENQSKYEFGADK